MPAQDTLQMSGFSERFDTPHGSGQMVPAIRKRQAEGLTLLLLALIVLLPFGALFFATLN